MGKKKALLIATVARFLDFEKNDIKILESMGYVVHGAVNFSETGRDVQVVQNLGIESHQIDFTRSPFTRNTVLAYRQLKKLLAEQEYTLVHCHTPVGGILGRLAARKYRKNGTKVIYTAHGFHFFKGGPLKNWLLFYPIEWLCSFWTDVLITINAEDFDRAEKHFHAKKTVYIPGVGIDTKRFRLESIDVAKKRSELGIPDDGIVLLSVGELNENKNHTIVINALAELKDRRLHYCIAGSGVLENKLWNMAESAGVNLHLLGYRDDVPELLNIADIFVHPSFREGLPVALMEAMAAGLPVIGSDIRGIRDLITVRGGRLFDPYDATVLAGMIKEVSRERHTRMKMGRYNLSAVSNFDKKKVGEIMENVYGRQSIQ